MSEQEQRNLIEYIIACVSEFSERFSFSLSEAYAYLYKFKGIAFLKTHYEIEHTLSLEEAVEDLITVCKKHGGNLT